LCIVGRSFAVVKSSAALSTMKKQLRCLSVKAMPYQIGRHAFSARQRHRFRRRRPGVDGRDQSPAMTRPIPFNITSAGTVVAGRHGDAKGGGRDVGSAEAKRQCQDGESQIFLHWNFLSGQRITRIKRRNRSRAYQARIRCHGPFGASETPQPLIPAAFRNDRWNEAYGEEISAMSSLRKARIQGRRVNFWIPGLAEPVFGLDPRARRE
jgi:hypothetical protein